MREAIYKHQKQILITCVIVLILSLVPVFMIAGVDCASGDDYNYGANAHLAFVSTGSVVAALKAAIETVIWTYKGWQGTWFDCFVFCLHPEVFSDNGYVLVPYIFIALQVMVYLGFAHHFLKTRWNLGKYYWAIIGLLFLIFSFQLVPSQKSAIFWWVGSVHYAMPMCMALCGIVLGDKYILHHRIRDLIWLCIIAALIGGATYPAALLLPMAVFLIWLAGFVYGGEHGEYSKYKDKRNFFLFVPLVLEMIGLILSVIAPGNAVRSASDISQGAEPSGGAVATIIKSIIFSVQDAVDTFIAQKTFVLILFLVVVMVTVAVFEGVRRENAADLSMTFAHPVLFALVMFLLNASMYAPRLYAGGVVSSGYFNFNFWTFCLCTIACTIYLCGYVIFTRKVAVRDRVYKISFLIALLTCLVIAFVGRHGVKEYTDYKCLEYYRSGQAADYKEQMALQRMLMQEEGVEDVVVPEVNNEQGPLMQMPIVSDPDNIDNVMTARFYGKNSCRSISRNEWIEKYGEKYGIIGQ